MPEGSLVQLTGSNDVARDAAALRRGVARGRHRMAVGPGGHARSVDVLVIDEAGQFSLANAVAAAPARSLVLLGDPQQLTQPSQATHPYAAGISALEHLIGDHDTMPPDRGIFLGTTFRMHPDVTRFVSELSYEGRLASAPDRERQEIGGEGPLSGSGLRWVPVAHEGCSADSEEEAAVVAGLVKDLLVRSWTDTDGVTHPMTEDDVLVVAPFNARGAAPGGPARKHPGRHGRPVPGARGARGRLLHGELERGRRTPRCGLPLRPAPLQRRGLAGPSDEHRRGQPSPCSTPRCTARSSCGPSTRCAATPTRLCTSAHTD